MPPRPPPLTVELSREALAACRRDPTLAAGINAIMLRAGRRLRALLGGADTPVSVTIAGRRERITLQVVLSPPDIARVERTLSSAESEAPSLSV